MYKVFVNLLVIMFLSFFFSCSDSKERIAENTFVGLSSDETGINFINTNTETNEINYQTYGNYYNGGGVAVGDINNDGLSDIFFTGNMVEDKLYLNQGNMKFKDITTESIDSKFLKEGWHTGVTMVDINADGWLDIYVSRSGWYKEDDIKRNLLFINNKDLTFTEKAKEYGIDDPNHTNHSAFFDYDNDGDLDLYVLNHLLDARKRTTVKSSLDAIKNGTNMSDKLYRNDNGKFIDVSKESGINNNAYGLGVAISDLNNDGWSDIYISNDYEEPDYLYINNGDGTFTDKIKEQIKHISNFSMGNDASDFNNDGFPDIVSVDMAFRDHVRSKRNMSAMSPEKFYGLVKVGWHHQYMTNTLQLNNGNGSFSEIAQMSGIGKSDWSWAPLFADFDNDGFKDLFISNGFKRDTRDNDFMINAQKLINESKTGAVELQDLIDITPVNHAPNHIYKNNGDLTFIDKVNDWGFSAPALSSGTAYADLDNDGDLDLVINNMDEEASILENRISNNNYLKIKLKGTKKNTLAIGSKAEIKIGEEKQFQELFLSRGFQSSVEPTLFFGLGKNDKIDELKITWNDGKITILKNINANQLLEINYTDSKLISDNNSEKKSSKYFTDKFHDLGLYYKHTENEYNDFEKEILLPHKQSQNGPCYVSGDVNGDKLDDIFVGGAANQEAHILFQKNDGTFYAKEKSDFSLDNKQEDLGAVFFDLENDGDLDLYVVSGGNEFEVNNPIYQDRLYVNDGNGNFTKNNTLIPQNYTSGKRVVASDFDKDGDMDLFVGGRVVPGKYPSPPNSHLLINEKGKLIDKTQELAPELSGLGMVTDAGFNDYDNDGDLDLIMTGEWMPITIFENKDNRFFNATEKSDLLDMPGWWMSIACADLDHDGDMDFVAGNIGLNNKFKPSSKKPLNVFCNDFDENGKLDIVLSKYQGNKHYPVRGRECSSQQMPFIKEKFPTFKEFAEATVEDIYTPQELEESIHYQAKEFASAVFLNNGDNTFKMQKLPNEAQLSPIQDILLIDVDNDSNLDIIAAGNLYVTEVETVRYDAGVGVCLLGDGTGKFKPVNSKESGWYASADVRDLEIVNTINNNKLIIIANNDNYMQSYLLNNSNNGK